ncbi:MAG: tetratricopeptide repeat protein [Chitinispirillia bacterium]|nr:tetratricopeptide repeat protein [Chitinispirillia bacterium]MCL2241072.1 tetratricopeptide repeat protein [Chitinispirillia bacterium]
MSIFSNSFKINRLSPSLLLFSLTALILLTPPPVWADAEFDRLIGAKNYTAALDYADSKLPAIDRSPAVWVKVGRANEELDYIEKALACYMVAWRVQSGEYQALLGIARIYNKMEQYDNALPMAEAALKVNFTAEASWEYARACIALKRPADAKQALEKVIASDPNNAIANRELGNIYFNDGEFGKAIPLMRRSYQEKADGEVAFRIGKAYLEAGMRDSAVIYLKIAADRNASAAEARGLMARALVEGRKFKEAIEPLEALVKAQPNNIEYLRMLSACYESAKAREKLAENDKRLAAVDKKDLEVRLRLAAFAESKDDHAAAVAPLREATVLDPKNADLFKRLAAAAGSSKQGAAAVAAMREYVKLNPSEADGYRLLGDYQYNVKDLDGALASYQAAQKIDPKLKGYHKRYAEIQIAKGQTQAVITTLTAVIKNGEADVSTYNTLGMIYHGRKQYKEALGMYREALKLEPSNFDALVAMGQSQVASGDINGAVITYEQAVMMNTGAVQEYKELGDLYTKQKKDAEALRSYMRYLDKNPTDRAIAASVGRLLFGEQKYADAAKYIQQSQTADPSVMQILGESLLRSGKVKDAIAVLEDLRGRKPRVAGIVRVLALLGEAYEQDKRGAEAAKAYAEYIAQPGVKDQDAAHKAAFLQEKENPGAAVKIYEANIKSYPNDMRNILRLGVLYSQRGENAKALPLLQRSTAAADANPELWLQIAQVYNAMGRDSSELAAYQRFIRTNPQHVEANSRIGALLMRRGDYSSAMINLEIANTMSPNDPVVLSLLARGYVQTKRNNEAISILARAKAAKPDDATIRYQLYEVYQLAKQNDKALEEIKQLTELKKEGRYLLAYGQMLIQQKKAKEAEGIVTQLLAQDPMNTDAMILRGFIHRANGKFQEALEVYEEILSILPGYAPALFETAETYIQMKQMPRAEMNYKRALRADPSYAMAELGLAKLYKSRKDMNTYKQHLQNAQRLAPDNEDVLAEVKSSAGK